MSDSIPKAPPDLPIDAHKGVAGRVLVVAGSEWMPGAAILSARAAQRAGAGLVGVVVRHETVKHALPITAPEAVMIDARTLKFESGAWHAGLVGPGLGLDASASSIFARVVAELEAPLVLDADALTLLAHEPSLATARTRPTVLTPHTGEAARLIGSALRTGAEGRLAAAREIALKTRSICCLKGPRTVVTDGERVYVNTTGDHTLATAGSGDVLAGILVAYLALVTTLPDSGWTAFDAAARAVFVHGRSGDLCRAARVSRSVIASDLIEMLSRAQTT